MNVVVEQDAVCAGKRNFFCLHYGDLRKLVSLRLRKTWLLHKQIKNRATLAYKNSVKKCYQGLFFIANMQFNNPTSMPQT